MESHKRLGVKVNRKGRGNERGSEKCNMHNKNNKNSHSNENDNENGSQ